MIKIEKKDGTLEPWNADKIKIAVTKSAARANVSLSSEDLEDIAKAVEDKIFLNQLYNACYSKKEEQALTEFKFILKNINYFINRGHNAVYAALSIFNKISYLQKRDIMVKVIRKLNNHEHDNKQILKKESFSYEGKVA